MSTVNIHNGIRGYNVNVNAPKLMVREHECLMYRSGLMLSQSVRAARGPNHPKALKKLVFSDYVPNIFFNVNHYIAVPALSGQDYKKEVSRNLFFAEGPEIY
jgi:hypothetical protein